MKTRGGASVFFRFLLRCRRSNGRQFSYARVRVVNANGNPVRCDALYLYIDARSGFVTRQQGVSEREALLDDEIEDGVAGYVVRAAVHAQGPDAEATADPLDECANR